MTAVTSAAYAVESSPGMYRNGHRRSRPGGNVRLVGATRCVLAERLAAGDEEALVEAYDAYAPVVYAVARRVLGDSGAAPDVVQEVFVELWCHPDRYDPTLGSLRTYLSLLARHRACDVVRSELRRIGREERHRRLVPEQRLPSPPEEVAAADTACVVRDAVRLLPPDQRTVVELAYFGGLSYRDVADAVGIPEGTAKSRIRLALAKLESILDRQLLESS
jgi:RNA polymerase sigma-70 factor (ECF subfamily)